MTTTIDRDLVIRPNPRATYRKLADGSGGVLLHLDTAAYHGLNEVGAFVWSVMEAGITFGDLMERLSAEFVDAPPTLEDDIAYFLRSLEERGLVQITPADDH
jgi:hypothetical protein